MKSFCLSFIFLLSCTGITFSQNYQCVHGNDLKYFSGQTQYLGIRIDSVVVNGTDSLFYSHTTQRDTAIWSDCQYLYGPSWLGAPFVVSTNGYNYAFTRNQDTLFFKVDAVLNESWMFYHVQHQGYVIATVTNIDTILIDGLIDSVKTIQLEVYDTLGNPGAIWAPTLSQMEFKICKHNGFYKIFDFYDLPNYYNTPDLTGSFVLKPVRIPTWKEIFDINPGDEFHYKIRNYDLFCNLRYPDDEERRYVTGRVDDTLNHTVSITYLVHRIDNIFSNPPPIITSVITTFNLTEVYRASNDPVCSQFPYEPAVHFDSTGYSDYHFYTYEHFICDSEMFVSHYNGMNGIESDSIFCISYPLDGPTFDTGFVAGVGYAYLNESYCGEASGRTEKNLVYYLKNGIACGVPVMTSINDFQNDNFFSIFPQPASDFVYIVGKNLNNETLYSLFDLTGKLVVKNYLGKENKIEIPKSCKSGIYFLRIENGDKVFNKHLSIVR